MLNLRPSAFEIEARGDRLNVAGNAAAAAHSERIESSFMESSRRLLVMSVQLSCSKEHL